MKALTSREIYLYKSIINALSFKRTSDGRIVFDIMITGIPDKYDKDEVTSTITKVTNCVYDILDDPKSNNFTGKEITEEVTKRLLGEENV